MKYLHSSLDSGTPLPLLPGFSSPGRFEWVLRGSNFAVTAELSPPDSIDPEEIYLRARVLDGYVDAINAVDGPRANSHMSSVGVCALLTRIGYAPVMQVSCRDKNRLAIQGDLLAAAGMGVTNVLCLAEDAVNRCAPDTGAVFDLDGVSLLETIRVMRDESRFSDGHRLESPPKLLLGASINPFTAPYEFQAHRLAKKIAAGAQFVQTHHCFDVRRLEQFMARVRDIGLDEKCFILAGVSPLASAEDVARVRDNDSGVYIPEEIVTCLRRARKPKLEGMKLCLELMQQISHVAGVSGIHVITQGQEETVAEIIEASGVLRGRIPWYPRIDEQFERPRANL